MISIETNRKTKRILLVISIIVLVATVAVCLRYCGVSAVSAASGSGVSENAMLGTLEAIPENEVPLAAAATPEEQSAVAATQMPAVPTPKPAEPTPTASPMVTAPAATPTAAPTATPTAAPTATPTAAPTATPVPSTTATRLLERANALLAQYYACATAEEKRALLGITNNNFSNDSFRLKLLSDLGGTWEQLEEEVVDATQYQQDKTLYVQVYISGPGSDYVPVVYSTKNADLSGSNQWSTNLVYDDETALWMEYTQKHPYNDSRVGYSMTTLGNKADGWEELKDTMETSPVWQEVIVDDTGATPTPDPGVDP